MTRTLQANFAALALLILLGCGGASAPVAPAGPALDLAGASVEALQQAGPVTNRINLVLIGDGYRQQDQAKLTRDAQNWLAAFRTSPPFGNYAGYFNISLIHLVSSEDGAGNGMYGLGVTRATALGANFQNANPAGKAPDYRLLVVDNGKAQSVAMALAPECTRILVLVNDANYGGSGGVVATFSANPDSCRIAMHEFGHAFAGLADEYQCGDSSALPATLEAYPNVTAIQDPEQIKWRAWIKPGTALPTPASWLHAADLGLFEGAYFHDTGVFRPRQNCRMRSLTDAFCEVCSEAIVNRIYDQVQPLDDPAPAAALTLDGRAALELAVARPVPSPDTIQVTWTVDGAPVAAKGDHLILAAGALAPGAHQISAQVLDATPLIRNGSASRQRIQTWTVNPGTALVQPMVVSQQHQQHQLLRVIRNSGGFEVVERRIIDLPLPAAPDPDRSDWTVAALGADGSVSFQTGIEDPTRLRGEFQHPEDRDGIQGRSLDEARPVSFLIRMPLAAIQGLAISGQREPAGGRKRLGMAVLAPQ